MSVSRSSTPSPARKSTTSTPAKGKARGTRGGKAQKIAKEMEAKRAKTEAVPHWHKYIEDNGDREGTISDIESASASIPLIMRFQRLNDIAERIMGWRLGRDRRVRVLDDNQTIEIHCNDSKGFVKDPWIIGVLPEGYSATYVSRQEHDELNGCWVGRCEDIEELQRRVKHVDDAIEKVEHWLCGQEDE